MKTLNDFRVLYADDNQDHCFMLSVLLGFSDIEVVVANTVTEAWKLAQNQLFDLYLLDVQFPDGSGLELCRNLRKYDPHKPILMYSGNAYESDKQKGLAAGADAYLTKPFIDKLPETIISAIELSKKHFAEHSSYSFAELQHQMN